MIYQLRRGKDMKEIHAINRTYKQGAELPYRMDAIHVNEKGKKECVYHVEATSLGSAINDIILGTDIRLKEALELTGPLAFGQLPSQARGNSEACEPPYDDWILLMRR
jgi:hypothetical protein